MREFKKVSVIGLEFYVDYFGDTGEIICIKEVHSGRRMICDGIEVNGVSLMDLFKESVGIEINPLPSKEEVKSTIIVEDTTGDMNAKKTTRSKK